MDIIMASIERVQSKAKSEQIFLTPSRFRESSFKGKFPTIFVTINSNCYYCKVLIDWVLYNPFFFLLLLI